MAEPQENLTRMLRAASSGERTDLDALMAAIYDDLHRLAVAQMRGERQDHTLQPTAVVHEAYMRLIDQHTTDWNDRAHFFAIASRVIRRILVDHARGRDAEKRGGGRKPARIDGIDLAAAGSEVDLIELDEALRDLSEIDDRQARVVEMRFFGGLSIDEIARALDVGRRSVDRDWSVAKAWLFTRLAGADLPDAG